MKIPTDEQMEKLLDEKLASDYPDESIQMGENWELLAEIFYKAGYEAGSKE